MSRRRNARRGHEPQWEPPHTCRRKHRVRWYRRSWRARDYRRRPLPLLLKTVSGDVDRHERCDDGGVRIVGLDEHAARLVAASRAAGDLLNLQKAALRRPQIPAGEAEISINDADECQVWEVITLGHKLRADHHVD